MWSCCLCSLELSHVFLAGCASLPQMCSGLSDPCTGVMLSPWEPSTPLLWFRLCCPGTAFPVLPGCGVGGRAGTHTAGWLYSVSWPSRFTRWSKISYLFWFFSPHGWIEKRVRVSVALWHTVRSGGWRNCCRSHLQPCICWLLLYPWFSLAGAGQ